MKQNRTLFIKSIIYRPYSEFVTFLIAWVITGNIKLSIAIGAANLFMKIISYFIFDLFWNKFIKVKYSAGVIWMTGLSGAGKTAIADMLCQTLKQKDVKCIMLDGDEMRSVFPSPIGFDQATRIKHNVNIGYMASILERQGYVVIVSMISPFKEARSQCRLIAKNFIEVYVNTPIEVCEKRDVKGLYARARRGEIKEFTGIDSPYESPVNPEIIIDTTTKNINECAKIIANYIYPSPRLNPANLQRLSGYLFPFRAKLRS